MHLFCSGAPPRNGCTAPYRVQRPSSGAAPPCLWRLWRLSGLWGSSGLELSSAWTVFRVGSLRHLMLWFLRNVARNSPTRISNIEITSLELQRFRGAAQSSGTRITCECWMMRRPRRTPVFGRRPTTLSTIPGTLRTPPPHPTMRRATNRRTTVPPALALREHRRHR